LGPLGTAATNRPVLTAPGDYDDGEICGMIGRWKPKYSEKSYPSAALYITNPTCCSDANLGRHGGKPATNRGTANAASETLCLLEYRAMYKVQESRNPEP
jgi:hypothetical protein